MKADDPILNPHKLDMRELLDTSIVPGMDGLDDELVEVADPIILPEVKSDVTKQVDDFKNDYNHTRESLYHRSVIGMELLKDAAASARNTDNPKFIQAVVSLMSELSEIDNGLMSLHNNSIKIKSSVAPMTNNEQKQISNTTVIEGTVMTSAELMDDDYD